MLWYSQMNGDDVRELRNKLGLSMGAFAERVGVSLHEVWRWEHGQAKPSPMAVRLFEQLKKEVDCQ